MVGRTRDHWECTLIIDLPKKADDLLVLHPAGVSMYTVTTTRHAIQQLHETLTTGGACAVPVHHEAHGDRLLCLRPTTLPAEPPWTDRPADAPPHRGPMELYLGLPDSQISIIFPRDRVLLLARTLTQILNEEDSVAQ
ncbi:hypothetical protein BU204_14880 [Actinophytocola xanthii]|uniref:Uncharacterized protein n=1 Tax=Actinophytocola xanthii TaxID=1912961 RepID=A0A1Q8CQX2_9PSEU|nr:hypothetical protein BU204_14880 [Actinophytocola xanthii]